MSSGLSEPGVACIARRPVAGRGRQRWRVRCSSPVLVGVWSHPPRQLHRACAWRAMPMKTSAMPACAPNGAATSSATCIVLCIVQAPAAALLSLSDLTRPAHGGAAELGIRDMLGALVLVAAIIGEGVADDQMRRFRKTASHGAGHGQGPVELVAPSQLFLRMDRSGSPIRSSCSTSRVALDMAQPRRAR